MSGASFTACATQPISFYEASVRYLQVGEPTTFYWLGKKVQIVEIGDMRLEGIQKRLGVYPGVFSQRYALPSQGFMFEVMCLLVVKLPTAGIRRRQSSVKTSL
jgi:hypothetical protein